MRYAIAVLAIAGIVVSCLALAQHYGAPAQPIDLMHSAWNSAYVNQSSFATVYRIARGIAGRSWILAAGGPRAATPA